MPSLAPCRHVEAVVLHNCLATRAEWCQNCGATRIYPAPGRLGHWKKPTYNNLANRINDVMMHYYREALRVAGVRPIRDQATFVSYCNGTAEGLKMAHKLVWNRSVKSVKI